MKTTVLIGGLAIIVIGGIVVAGNKTSTPQSGQVKAVTTTQQSDAHTLPVGTKIYDVRTAEEFQTSHVAAATLFPLTDLQSGKMPADAKDAPIAVYCRSGHRAGQAESILKQSGYTNVINLGGLNDLAKYGLKAE